MKNEEILSNDKKEIIKKEESKTYINICCCELNIGLAITYFYVFSALVMNLINRIIFHNYYFRFNFIYSFLGQFICLIMFLILGRIERIKKDMGEISFPNFLKFKYYYISFSIISIINILIGFYGNQLVNNISMFLSLKKFTVVYLLFIDIFYSKRKISLNTIICIFLIVSGSILVGINTFSNDYLGYIVVFINNIIQIFYSKFIESYRNHTGYISLKLLYYSNYLSIPILLIGAYFNGEYEQIYYYFNKENFGEGNTLFGLLIYLSMSCFFTAILLSALFMSNEKSSSLMTHLLTNTKSVFISVLLYFFDKSKNKLNLVILIGLIMSTAGSILVNAETIFKNISLKNKNKKDELNNDENKKEEEMELIDINDESNKK